MTRTPMLLLLMTCGLHADAGPVLLDPPVEFPSAGPGSPSLVRYLGQPAKDGRIDLTATNGFFDRCFRAEDQGPVLPGDEGLISAAFDHLRGSGSGGGTARWHLWCPEPGEFHATFHLTVPTTDNGHQWTIRFDGQSQTFTASPEARPSLTFHVTRPGTHVMTIDATATPPPPGTRIHFVTLDGPAIASVHLLRARWRPAAVHQSFEAPPECGQPNLWVFETRAVAAPPSYSPLTTPFGYYGTSFNAEGKVSPGASFNFSMWLARRGAEHPPPIDRMPRILATGLPDATFGWFSHEGTGVKLRGAVAYPDGADRTIQALRVEHADGLWTYYGYFYDEGAERWKLFAAGRQLAKFGRAPDPSHDLLRRTGSFCEIPGPPARERSGDLVRVIKRRGWFLGPDRIPHRAVMSAPRTGRTKPLARPQRTYYADDYQTQGWMVMATGGIEHFLPTPPGDAPTADTPEQTAPLPDYLAPEKLAQLDSLPVRFGEPAVTGISTSRAVIDYPLTETGPNSKASLYYGTIDAITYPATKINGGSPAVREMFAPERTWQHATPSAPVNAGPNRFQLDQLKPDTTYHFRLRVEHDHGKSWDFRSASFRTRP
ncbi:fibronectin type III domain-containing protein [Haloferula sp. A504]|uniref:fibronectin type III domain-containing protein n=1 Tax=Haloferula sp. A504 TaxID=3373601 RepID=UPI0031C19232|nr:fibronectin type III domain-containing protein [Verrucomicrobiaceae bacterium E54]